LVNNDLANTIGNLLNRTSSMARKWFDACVPPAGDGASSSHPLAQAALSADASVLEALQRLDFRSAAEAILALAQEANGFLNDQAPWKQIKQPEQRDAVGADLYAVLEAARLVAVLLTPLLPELSGRMLAQLGFDPLPSDIGTPAVDAGVSTPWDVARCWGQLTSGSPLPEPVPVMQRLELDTPL
ncbi:MAG: methionine--tRNA ligase, partial [Cyanobium sp.]